MAILLVDFFPKMLLFIILCVTPSGLFKIYKMWYLWKDLSLLILLRTNLIASTET